MAYGDDFCTDASLRSEKAFIAFAESFADPIFVVSEQGEIVFCNRALLTLLGYCPDDVLGKPPDTIFSDFEAGTCRAVENKKPAADNVRYTLIMTAGLMRKDRIRLAAEVTMCPLHIRDVSRIALVCRLAPRPNSAEAAGDPAEARQTGPASQPGEPHSMQLIGNSPAISRVRDMIEMVAKTDSGVLITGDSGTGKELVAESLHAASPRSDRPLIKLNCSALPETLLESELFGHVKGSFTGAIKDTPGRFQTADGGTLFLDEIGDISPSLQVKLLRVLQDQEFNRIGESTPIKVDVRIIAATNQDLGLLIRQKLFREDLYYRLKVIEIAVPPLRQRAQDIPLLVDHFLVALKQKFNKGGVVVSREVLNLFSDYSWPGNIRELAHALEHAFIICDNDRILPHHLPQELQKSSRAADPATAQHSENLAEQLRDALGKTGGNKARAARLLGIDRKTLYRHIKKYNISFTA